MKHKTAQTPKVEIKKPQPQQSQKGKWVFKPLRSKILLCECGNKFVATQPNQKTCLFCKWDK